MEYFSLSIPSIDDVRQRLRFEGLLENSSRDQVNLEPRINGMDSASV
jgi:hypothetical protein